jgi:Ni,Fe-hydrogenase I cytochrome b subunit
LKKLFEFLKRLLVESMGEIATSSLLVCVVSGIFLAVPYHIANPLDSTSMMLLDNPAAAFIRNIHFWSAQFLLVFTILHVIDHLVQKTENNVSRGTWLRLTLSLPVLLFVMISGFILKGDADSLSAFRILSSLFERIPAIGDLLRATLLGYENSLELVYVHHIATATIILFIIIYEHSRKIWPSLAGFIMLLFIFLLMAYFLHAPLGQETGKGPWYFIGFQELLQWSSRPGWTWLLLLIILALVWVLPRTGFKLNMNLKNLLLAFLFLYIMITITGAFFRGENWRFNWPWKDSTLAGNVIHFHPLTLKLAEDFGYQEPIPVILGQREGCLVCHIKTAGIEKAHDPLAVGCLSCHGGNSFTLDKMLAHKGMILIPGNLSDALKSCGSAACHPEIPGRVTNSIMSTMSGVVTVDRFVFGENDSLSAFSHIKEIGHTAADQHLRDLCANCHLGNPKTETGPVTQRSRGGGCGACHLNYPDSAAALLAYWRMAEAIRNSDTLYHPQLNLEITDAHCFGCHSRSGRIATSYEGWHETMLNKENIPEGGKYRVLEDERVFEFVGDDVHHAIGMACIDCHISFELMGDGNLYAHEEEQTRIKCEDCHFRDRTLTSRYPDLDAESKKILAQRNWQAEGIDFIICKSSGKPLVNAWIDESGKAILRIKTGDSLIVMKPPAPVCTRSNAHKSLSCESCHTSWVPQCIGCHNTYDPGAKGFDMLTNMEKEGSWVEHVGRFMADKPTLGIVTDGQGMKKVRTFTPGMILSVDTASFRNTKSDHADLFHRLYAPISAHTTVREGRSCVSCHLDPLAIGYGRGELVYDISSGKGQWIFRNKFALNNHDHLPEDAWTGFLSERTGISSTRENARPFNFEEQKAILTVGACLTCHKEDSPVIKKSLTDFPALLKQVSPKCILPVWSLQP